MQPSSEPSILESETPVAVISTANDRYWEAVVQRDAKTDGTFYYSVSTTGIYCRPSCASRLPRRENVRFHATIEDAEHAGFRPCKRCRPREVPLAEQQSQVIVQACRLLEAADPIPNLEALASEFAMSKYHFHRLFKAKTGLTPKAYAVSLRTDRMKKELRTRSTVTEAIFEGGFSSSGHFYGHSDQLLGMAPGNYRQGGLRTTIQFAVEPCSLGKVLVGATDKGLCAIFLGDDPTTLTRDLSAEFPLASLVPARSEFQAQVSKVVRFLDSPAQGLDLPLDIKGTVFQTSVWGALRKVPIGETRTYQEIAEAVGRPRAVRAVARACAANLLAVAIPCHRVIRASGELSGYRWGADRKKTLLARER